MTEQTERYYGVSSGDGNNGISHMWPDYIVKTNEPWLAARLAAVTDFKPGRGRKWCRANLEVDGEAEYSITAILYDPPGRDNAGWSEHNGAWSIYEVFPWEGELPDSKPIYANLQECFGRREVAIERKLDR